MQPNSGLRREVPPPRPPRTTGRPSKTLTDAVSITIRRLHDSPRTEEAYVHWVREFVRFHRRASASTQNQALCALVFLYRKVLEIEMPALDGLGRAQRPQHLPNVRDRRDVLALLERLEPPVLLLGQLLYGAGLRVQAALSLRVKDIDIEGHQVTVRRGNDAHDRAALLPALAGDRLVAQLDDVRRLHDAELSAGRGEVDVPYALCAMKPAPAPAPALRSSGTPLRRRCLRGAGIDTPHADRAAPGTGGPHDRGSTPRAVVRLPRLHRERVDVPSFVRSSRFPEKVPRDGGSERTM